MANHIAGMKINDAAELLGVSRMTLHRYRKSPDWPGDEAQLPIIRAYVSAKKGIAGRRSKTVRAGLVSAPAAAQPSTPAPRGDDAQLAPIDDDMAEYLDAMSLDEEMKRTMIEKNKAAIREYQLKAMETYRHRLTEKINKALDIVFDELHAADLTPAQIDNIRQAIRRAQVAVAGGKNQPQQPELL